MEPDFLNPDDIIKVAYGLIDEAIKASPVMGWYSNSTESVAAKARVILAQILNASGDTEAANLALDLAIEMHTPKTVIY